MAQDQNFLHKYELVVARQDSLVDSDEILNRISNPSAAGVTPDFITETQNAIKITNLHITADIDKTRVSKSGISGPAVIKVYGLSKSTLERIRQDDTIFLKAGYEGSTKFPLVFVGQIASVKTRREKDNGITTIIASDSQFAVKNLRVSGRAESGDTYSDTIKSLLKIYADNGVPTGDFDEYSDQDLFNVDTSLFSTPNISPDLFTVNPTYRSPDTGLENGRNYEGTIHEVLKDIAEEIGYIVFYSMGSIYVRPKTIFGTPILYDYVTITSELLKQPVRPEKDSIGVSYLQGGKSGVIIETFLNGAITTDKRVILDTGGSSDGDYIVQAVKHRMSYEGSQWNTTATLRSI